MEELEAAIKCTPREQDAIRMRAIRGLILEQEPKAIATIFDVSLKTLYTWVRDFNGWGLTGLMDMARSGRPRVIPDYLRGPLTGSLLEPSRENESHWTAKKFHGFLKALLRKELSYATAVRFIHEQGLTRLSPRPWPDKQDQQLREQYLWKQSHWIADPTIEIWFADESGFEGDPRPRKRWAKIGSSPTRTKNGGHLRLNAIGLVAPRTGEFFAIEASGCDTDTFQAFLDEANKSLPLERDKNYLVLDNASWHKAKDLRWGKFTPIYLPPYSPDFNPIEKLWQVMKDQWFTDFVARNAQQLEERLDKALNWAIDRPADNVATCALKTRMTTKN